MDQQTKDLIDAAPVLPSPPAGLKRLAYTHYCREDLLSRAGNDLIANWERNFSLACDGLPPYSSLRADSVLSLERLKKCADSGKWVLICEHY